MINTPISVFIEPNFTWIKMSDVKTYLIIIYIQLELLIYNYIQHFQYLSDF